MRAFIAIPLTEEVHTKLALLQDRLMKPEADVKWVKPCNIHLTLKFLGDADKDKIQRIISALKEALKTCARFDISIAGTGAFPGLSYPKIIWAGISEGKSQCILLQKAVEPRLKGLGFDKKALPFSPHLTLGRVRSGKNIKELINTLKTEKDFGIKAKIPVNKITLFSSTLTPKGPIYESLEEFLLPEVY
jgi:RNA 2',3'-cyclic 3'-phosphodiesterase